MKGLEDEQISQSTISKIENGDPSVSEEKYIYYIQKLGLRLDQIPQLIAEQHQQEERVKSQLFLIETNIGSISLR